MSQNTVNQDQSLQGATAPSTSTFAILLTFEEAAAMQENIETFPQQHLNPGTQYTTSGNSQPNSVHQLVSFQAQSIPVGQPPQLQPNTATTVAQDGRFGDQVGTPTVPPGAGAGGDNIYSLPNEFAFPTPKWYHY